MVQKKYGGFLLFLLVVNFIAFTFKIDLTASYLFLGFMMFLLSFSTFIYLNIKINNLSKEEHVNTEAIDTLNSVLASTPSSMLTSVLPYVVVSAINLALKAFVF